MDKLYPPAEAIVQQLNTIRAIIPPTVKIFESTGSVDTIQPNLDMIQRAINYLRGEVLQPIPPAPEDKLNPTFIPYFKGAGISVTLVTENEYQIAVHAVDVEPTIKYPELFGDPGVDAVTMSIKIPVICGHTYKITQINPILSKYENDPNIIQNDDGSWVKEKDYLMEKDDFEYAFLLSEGRVNIEIYIEDLDTPENPPALFNISSHIHFKEKDEVQENENSGSNG